MIAAAEVPRPELPARPAPVPLPEGAPFGFVLRELAERLGLDAYPVKHVLHDLRAWITRRDPTRPLTRPVREEPDWGSNLGELRPALWLLGTLMRDRPEEGTAPVLSQLCQSAALWAERCGALLTALAFAQACSDLLPDDPASACLLGRLARKAGQSQAARHWLRWARQVAARQDDTHAEAQALLLGGLLLYDCGELRRAELELGKAARAACDLCEHRMEADAHAALAVLCYEQGRPSIAATHAISATTAYGAGSAGLVEFATELAWAWTGMRVYAPAATLCEHVSRAVADPLRRALLHALQCRALCATQDDRGQERAWNLAWAALGQAPQTGGERAFVLLQLARAADTRGHYTRADAAARAAYEAARDAARPEWARTAREMVAVLDGTRTDPAAMSRAFPDRAYVGVVPATEAAEEDADAVLEVLLTALAPSPGLDLPSSLRRALAAGLA